MSNSFKDWLKQQLNYMLEQFIFCAIFLYLPLALSQKLFIVFVSFSRYTWPFLQSIRLIDKLPPAFPRSRRSSLLLKSSSLMFNSLVDQVFYSCYFVCFVLAAGICTDFSFKCKNKDCVNKVNAECDREDDCADGSDEQGCGESNV